MTQAAEAKLSEKEQEKAEREARKAEIDAKELEANKDRTGKGTRVMFGFTKGKSSQMISYENWDESQADTLPVDYAECIATLEKRGVAQKDIESAMVKRFILGDNELLYAEAADPVSEFVDPIWPDAVQKSFKMVIKSTATNNGMSIEETVALIKPAYVAAEVKRQAVLAATPVK
jgi:hypothetical protein